MMFEIKSRWNGSVLFSAEVGSLRLAVEAAVRLRADLVGADLAGADLAGADLAGANLACADLARADLVGANLAGADLAGADLVGANLVGANLARADLARADLARADLARADLARATYGEGVPMTAAPIFIGGLMYNVLILDAHSQIGCKLLSLHDWLKLDADGARGMDGDRAVEFHRDHLPAVLAMAKACGRSFDELAAPAAER